MKAGRQALKEDGVSERCPGPSEVSRLITLSSFYLSSKFLLISVIP